MADRRRAVRFIRQHARDYGVDPDRTGLEGADLERVNAAMVRWFERHLERAAK